MFNESIKRQGDSFVDIFSLGLISKSIFENTESHRDSLAVKTITFQVTEDCSLKCSYCYEINKSKKSMSFETAKKFIDMLIEDSYKEDSYVYIGDTKAVILEFIGGEPLLKVDLIHEIMDYFIYKTTTEKHPWAINYMISMISNGVHYFENRVQELFEKYQGRLSFSMSLDGNKELHDACRVFPNGAGSYDIVEKACLHYMKHHNPMMGTKLTVAPENIDYMFVAFKNLLNLGYKVIHANPIYEENWSLDYAKKYYAQLKQIGDYILENDLEKDIYISLFNSNQFTPMSPTDNQNYCGSTGSMLSLDCNGGIYPCIRFMSISLGDSVEPYKIGDIETGIGKKPKYKYKIDLLNNVTRKSQSTEKCFNCPIATGCGHCTAYNYQVNKTPNKKLDYICNMHKARSLANAYYFNKLYLKHKKEDRFKIYLDEKDVLDIIEKDEYTMLLNL